MPRTKIDLIIIIIIILIRHNIIEAVMNKEHSSRAVP